MPQPLILRYLLYGALPQRLLSRFGGWVARRRLGLLTKLFIRWFARHYGVDMREAAIPDIRHYASFSEFFVRALRTDARRWPDVPASIASPVDGVASQAGTVRSGLLLQAKGIDYSLHALLNSDPTPYLEGGFATLYLRPRDYHRVHMPVAGRLTGVRHVPGRLWPVRPWAVSHVPGLFTRNERLVLEFLGAAGPWALILVGALMVGGLESVVTGPVRSGRGHPRCWNLEAAPRYFERGDEIARFHFGSTVVLVFGPAQVTWDLNVLQSGSEIRLGQPLGTGCWSPENSG